MPKVSVVVPAYNAHDYLARCLGSLVHQTLEDIEVVVINDASSDDTLEICNRCKAAFPDKIVVVDSKENMGCGGARTLGVDASTGDYIGFVDSDDMVSENMFELMYSMAMEKNADIVDCGIYLEANDKALLTTGDNVTGTLDDEKRKILILSGGYVTTKIFKRSLFEEPKVRFRAHVGGLEDNDIVKYMILRADNIWNVKEVMYNYSDTVGSAVKDVRLDSYYNTIYGVIGGIYDKCHVLPAYNRLLEVMEYTMINWYSNGVNRCLYDQIVKLGADKALISKYFDGAGDKEKQMLSDLAKEKKRVVTIPYRDNKEVMSRISELDLAIMEECDRRYT